MTVHLPTLKQLQYLVALRQHGHFGRAAEACFVTQSTLSAGLRELETLLGVTLVERTRRVVRFTPLGEKIADKALRVLRETEELADMARAEGQPLHGELRMGVIPTIAPVPATRDAAAAARANGRAQALPARGDQPGRVRGAPPRPARLRAARPPLRLRRGRFRALVRRSACSSPSRAAKRPSRPGRRRSAIDENRLLLLEDGHCLKDHALSACNRPELRAHAAMMGTSLHTLVQMVDNGLGLTFVPAMAIDAGILEGTQVDAKPLTLQPRLPPDRAHLAPVEPARERVPAPRRDAAPDHARHHPGSRRSLPFPGSPRDSSDFPADTPRRRREVGAAAAEVRHLGLRRSRAARR